MDATTPTLAQSEVRCDVCGYPRNGLPAQALCPECGEPPPRLAQPQLTPAGDRTLTAARLAHLHTLTIGLFLLISSSITAVGVTLIMPVGPLSIAAMNVPAPKIHAAAMVQRNIGGPPGPWGIAGTTAALCGIIAVWILTTPQSLRADEEPTWSLRRLARWTGVLSAGGVLGALLTFSEYVSPQGPIAARMLGIALLLCELPANALLYAHLRRVAIDVGDRRAAATLERCVWLIPLATSLSGAIVLYGMLYAHDRSSNWPTAARVGTALYGAVAVAVGAAATSGVLRLLATCSGATASAWLPAVSGVAARLSGLIGMIVQSVRRAPQRWAIVAGLCIWLYVFASFAMFGLAYPGRYYGESPMLDFVGPRVPIVALAGNVALHYNGRVPTNELFRLCLFNLLAVWLFTWPAARGATVAVRNARLATVARWAALLLAGAMLGLGLWQSVQNGRPIRHPRVVAAIIAPVDAIATILVYLHLGCVATAAGKRALARSLRWRGIAATIVGTIPLIVFCATPPQARNVHWGLWMLAAAMVQGMASIAITFLCAGALARLAWTLATLETSEVPAIAPALHEVQSRENAPRPELSILLPNSPATVVS